MHIFLDNAPGGQVSALKRELIAKGVEISEGDILGSEAETLSQVDGFILAGQRGMLGLIRQLEALKNIAHIPKVILYESELDLRHLLTYDTVDFVMPPHYADEILLRIRARLKRIQTLQVGDCLVDLKHGLCIWPDRQISLTPTEVRLLDYFWQHAGQALSRQKLLSAVWGYDEGLDTRAVALAISRLRKKIEAESEKPVYLLTQYGLGYRWAGPGEGAAAGSTLTQAHQGVPNVMPWVGRAALLSQLKADLEARGGVYLLHGPGGIGKSRLALEVTRRLQKQFTIHYLDLSNHHDLREMRMMIVREMGWSAPISWVSDGEMIQFIRPKRGILILDNGERVMAALSPLLAQFGADYPLRILVTSRLAADYGALNYYGLEGLSLKESQRLFYDLIRRYLGQHPAYLTRGQVLQLLKKTDGSPLAIELLASHYREKFERQKEGAPSPALTAFIPDKSGGLRGQRLDEMLDESWSLLGLEGQRALVVLSVFRGGFSIASAQALWRARAIDPRGKLAQFSAHALIRTHGDPQEGRYALHQLIWQYSHQKAGAQEARKAHLRHFARMTQQLSQDITGPDIVNALHTFQLERQNILASFEFAATSRSPLSITMALALCELLWVKGEAGGLEVLAAVPAEIQSEGQALQLKVQRARFFTRDVGLKEAQALAQDCLNESRRLGDAISELYAQMLLASVEAAQSNIKGFFSRAPVVEELLEATNQTRLKAVFLAQVAACHRLAGRLDECAETQSRALEIAVDVGARWNESLIRSQLSVSKHRLGDFAGAERILAPQLHLFKVSGDLNNLISGYANLAIYQIDGNRLEHARESLLLAQELVHALNNRAQKRLIDCVEARLEIELTEWHRAQRLIDDIVDQNPDDLGRVVSHARVLRVWYWHLRGHFEKALGAAQRAREAYERTESEIEVAKVLLREASLYAELDQKGRAYEAWQRAQGSLHESEAPSDHQARFVTALFLRERGVFHPETWSEILTQTLMNGSKIHASPSAVEVRWAYRLLKSA